jgi:serine/threonine protein kinase
MYRLLYNSLPYTGQSWAELANNIKTLQLTFPVNVEIGDDARDLLSRLLRRDPYERYVISLAIQNNDVKVYFLIQV